MTRCTLPLVLVALATAGRAGSLTPQDDQGILVNAVVALVNGEPVTKLEVDARVADFLRANPEVEDDEIQKLWQEAREAVIEHGLLIQEAKRRNVEVEPDAVNEQIERYQKAGIDMEKRRDLVRERLMVERLLRRLISARSITPHDVTAYYEEHREDFVLPERRHVYLILVRSGSGGGANSAKEKARAIHQELKEGADLVAQAKAHSQGAYAGKGGDHGWLKKGALVEPIDEVVFQLKPGEISDPIPTKAGYAIVKVAAVEPAERQSLAKARATILDRLQAEHRLKRRRELIERLRSRASIIRLDFRSP
jgi:parvulin-like peptidyl-prolyl isomerase